MGCGQALRAGRDKHESGNIVPEAADRRAEVVIAARAAVAVITVGTLFVAARFVTAGLIAAMLVTTGGTFSALRPFGTFGARRQRHRHGRAKRRQV